MGKVAQLRNFFYVFFYGASPAILYQILHFELNRIKLMSANFTRFDVVIPLWP